VAQPLLQGQPETAQAALQRLLDIYGAEQLWVELQHHALPDDDWLMRQLLELARRFRLRIVATNDVHYATPAESDLRDVLVAIRHQEPLTQARRAGRLFANRSYHLADPAEMARRFRERPEALAASVAVAARCQVSLEFAHQRLPAIPIPAGRTEFEHLYQLCHDSLPRRYRTLTGRLLKQLGHELNTIETTGLAGFFLLVWDVVRFARDRGIRCQGRGSAANSVVAYLLGITNVDPLAHNLPFERFLSENRATMPDIDIDFAAGRREEVIQYVYNTYGLEHTAMVSTVITFQARSAVRDVGKTLELPSQEIDRLAKVLDTGSLPGAATHAAELLREELPADAPEHHPLALLAGLLEQIDGCPRHLSIHVGGMVITGPPLQELVPLEPATMPQRVVVQWDKDSVEDAGLIKLDLLGLRTLDLIAEAVEHIAMMAGHAPDLDALTLDDPVLYDQLNRADTIGVFQVESRAQQQLLPQLAPRQFEDIIVAVAIVRPGPIQGGAVHPYLKRRAGEEPVTYLHPRLESVLQETYGVLLYQEQVLQAAVAIAGFDPGEADSLRRALSRARSPADLDKLQARFWAGAAQQGVPQEIAAAVFKQIAGYAGYGFPKSHAAGFALISYQTLYLKHYFPIPFFCGLLNAQPMGFYPVEVVLNDAKRHGVTVLPPDIHHSRWRSVPEPLDHGRWGLRVGFCAITGVGEQAYRQLDEARARQPFADLLDFCARTRLPKRLVSTLIRAGSLDTFGARRALLWRLGELAYPEDGFDLVTPPQAVALPSLSAQAAAVWELELMGWSPQGSLVQYRREHLREQGVLITWQVKQAAAGRRVRVGGTVAIRQRPSTAKGIVFLSLEDESGLVDVVVKPAVYRRCREAIRFSPLVVVTGVVQRSGRVVSVLAHHIAPLLA
jgi:error-prone DNA polymerase